MTVTAIALPTCAEVSRNDDPVAPEIGTPSAVHWNVRTTPSATVDALAFTLNVEPTWAVPVGAPIEVGANGTTGPDGAVLAIGSVAPEGGWALAVRSLTLTVTT